MLSSCNAWHDWHQVVKIQRRRAMRRQYLYATIQLLVHADASLEMPSQLLTVQDGPRQLAPI